MGYGFQGQGQFALSNLWMAHKKLMAMMGQTRLRTA